VRRLLASYRAIPSDATVRLAKPTSNLFRVRAKTTAPGLDTSGLTGVIAVDPRARTADVAGMCTYEDLVAATLPYGLSPLVVPQLKTITLGGAVAGVGIESSSWRHGLVHDTMLELDVLLADGRVVTCTADNQHADLFFGFPNSYGTLGYALRVKARTVPVKRYVRLEHLPFRSGDAFFRALGEKLGAGEADFVDGTVFSPGEMYLTLARFTDTAPWTSDYTFERIYYRSIREKREDYLTAHDYIWRWDTDWFWCSKNVLAQNPLIRKLYGKKRLGSRTYTKIMRWNSRVGLTRKLEKLIGLHSESVIQDVDVPLARAAEFLDFYAREIALWPQWVCPIGPQQHSGRFSLYPVRDEWYVNFGFWDVKRTRAAHPAGHFNRLIERKVAELGGIKSLYSDSFFPREEFDRCYNGAAYRALKVKYDPQGAFPQLYDKCVLRH
jgi:FAD/FMN-containing dehydrogenase